MALLPMVFGGGELPPLTGITHVLVDGDPPRLVPVAAHADTNPKVNPDWYTPDVPAMTYTAAIEQAERAALALPQVECPVTHRFSDGCYLREVLMEAGTFVIGHKHKTRHFNFVLTGKATVMMDGEVHEIEAPAVFESEPGVRKVLFIREQMRWATVHVTPERDMEKLEELIIEKSAAFLERVEADKKRLKKLVNKDL